MPNSLSIWIRQALVIQDDHRLNLRPFDHRRAAGRDPRSSARRRCGRRSKKREDAVASHLKPAGAVRDGGVMRRAHAEIGDIGEDHRRIGERHERMRH